VDEKIVHFARLEIVIRICVLEVYS
jgi:hypothetical protein